MKVFISICFVFCQLAVAQAQVGAPLQLSQELLENIRDQKPTQKIVSHLESIPYDVLLNEVATKEQKLTFWMNIYNAFIQLQLANDPDSFEDKSAFYKDKKICIADLKLSFDDIEHGIIRNSRVKLGLGYFKKWFEPKHIRDLRNTEIDGRIHFALNCGAKDCPPIAIFEAERVDDQLNILSTDYLKDKSTVDVEDGCTIVKTTPLFSWFRGDFGGKKGIKEYLRRFGVTDAQKMEVEFKAYDWTLSLGNFTDL